MGRIYSKKTKGKVFTVKGGRKLQEKKITIEGVTEEFVKIYGVEERYMNDLVEKSKSWLINFENQNDESKQLIINLLSEMKFYPKTKIKDILLKQIRNLQVLLNDFKDTQMLPMTSKNGRSNGSTEMIQSVKELDKFHEFTPYEETIIGDPAYVLPDILNLVIFDDISGTGQTVTKFLTANKETFKGKNIYICFIAMTEIAETNINKWLTLNKEIKVTIIYEEKILKASERLPFLNIENLNLVKSIEEKIWGKGHRYVLGYEDSQLLLLFSHNIPNNTLSVFWYHPELPGKINEWNCLFKRYTRMKRPKRSLINMNAKKGRR